MRDIIYPDKMQAIDACRDYANAIIDLQNKLGIWETCDDSCCGTYYHVKYYEEDGIVKTFTYDP